MTHHTPSERSFGLSVGTVSLAIAALSSWRGYETAPLVLATAGVLLVVFGAVYPPALRVPNRVWWRFAQTLGWINSRILLTLFFFVVLTPAGAVMRMVGRNPLRSGSEGSNWMPYPARRRDPRHYQRLF